MPYTLTTLGQLKTQLKARLGQSEGLYWIDDELGIIIIEALRTWNSLTGFWRDRGQFALSANVPFYDITIKLAALIGPTVTDRDLIGAIEYHLQEPKSLAAWTGSEMFTYDDVVRAIERQRNQLLVDTGCRVTRDTSIRVGAGNGRVALAESTIAIRRAAWVGSDGTVTPLRRSDPWTRGAGRTTLSPGTPRTYSIGGEPVLSIELTPPPMDNGSLDLLLIQSLALDPANTLGVLQVPDDYTWIVKFGALADLLSKDGSSRDPQRAAYCRKRYDQGVDLLRSQPVILGAEVNGIPILPPPLASLDNIPNWQNILGAPKLISIAAQNMIASYPVLDGTTTTDASVLLDVVINAPIPANDAAPIQIGREQLDAIIGYAEHIAAFKLGGAEFYFTSALFDAFIAAATTYNERLGASTLYRDTIGKQSTAEEGPRPYRYHRERDVAQQ